jgi:hypothetical protein
MGDLFKNSSEVAFLVLWESLSFYLSLSPTVRGVAQVSCGFSLPLLFSDFQVESGTPPLQVYFYCNSLPLFFFFFGGVCVGEGERGEGEKEGGREGGKRERCIS